MKNSIEHGDETALSLRVTISHRVGLEGGSTTLVEAQVLNHESHLLQKGCQIGDQAVRLRVFPQIWTGLRGGKALISRLMKDKVLRTRRTSGRWGVDLSLTKAQIISLAVGLGQLGDGLRDLLSLLRRQLLTKALGEGQGLQVARPVSSKQCTFLFSY